MLGRSAGLVRSEAGRSETISPGWYGWAELGPIERGLVRDDRWVGAVAVCLDGVSRAVWREGFASGCCVCSPVVGSILGLIEKIKGHILIIYYHDHLSVLCAASVCISDNFDCCI